MNHGLRGTVSGFLSGSGAEAAAEATTGEGEQGQGGEHDGYGRGVGVPLDGGHVGLLVPLGEHIASGGDVVREDGQRTGGTERSEDL